MENIQYLDQKNIWHPFTQHNTNPNHQSLASAKGSYLYTEDGKKIFDGISSWWVNLHGHLHPTIIASLTDQLTKHEQVLFADFTHAPAAHLSEKLLQILPQHFSKIFFSDNGSTAVEVALKMSIQYFHNLGIKRKRIVAFKDAYHGDTFGCMSVSGRSLFTNSFSSRLFDVDYITPPNRCDESSYEKCLEEMSDIIKKGDLLCFIFEPMVQGAGGMIMHHQGTLNKLLKMVRDSKALLIADEVMTGFGRTGKMFAMEYLDIPVDIVCLAKGITNGTLPLSVTCCSNKIFNAFLSSDHQKTFYHGHSFTANSLGCAAALGCLSIFENTNVFTEIDRINSWYLNFKEELNNFNVVKNIRIQGTIFAFDIITHEATGYENSLNKKLKNHFYKMGVLLRPLGNTVYLMPPYCSTDDDLDLCRDSIVSFLEKM